MMEVRLNAWDIFDYWMEWNYSKIERNPAGPEGFVTDESNM